MEKIYQTLKTEFDDISKYLEVRKKYSAARRIFNSLLGFWKCVGQCPSCLIYNVKIKSHQFDIRFLLHS